jgi:hypothetical protein
LPVGDLPPKIGPEYELELRPKFSNGRQGTYCEKDSLPQVKIKLSCFPPKWFNPFIMSCPYNIVQE